MREPRRELLFLLVVLWAVRGADHRWDMGHDMAGYDMGRTDLNV